MKAKLLIHFSVIALLMLSCEEPLDPIIRSVGETNSLLQRHVWLLEDIRIEVRRDDIPPPTLFSATDSIIRPGRYDLDDMVFDASEMREHTIFFTPSRDVIASNGPIDVLGDSTARYFVINDRTIRIGSIGGNFNYTYIYDENNKTIAMTLTSEQAGAFIRDINEKLIDAISKKTPEKIGDIVAGLLFNNESIQRLINNLVVSALAGELEFINDFDPDETAKLLASRILEELEAIDWEGKLTDLLKTELEKITNIDPDAVAAEIAKEVSEAIKNKLSFENIYNFVLPYADEIAKNPEEIAENISTLIVNLFGEIFNEENLKTVIALAWKKFTMLDEAQVNAIADTLTSVVEEVWINQEQLSQLFLPITQKIDDTSLLQMGQLAAEATEAMKGLVDQINAAFPDLNLQPDYDSMEGQIKTILVAAKPVIGIIGPDKVAEDIAGLIISKFLNTENIQQVFVAAISFLQSIDPEIVGATIAAWLTNLGEEVAPEIIQYLSELFSPILDNMDPEFTSFKIALAISNFIKDNVTEEGVKELILPVFEFIANINAEAVARFIAQKILSLDIIEDVVNEDNIVDILLPVLQNINNTNVEELAQSLIDAIVNSGIFVDIITEDRVAAIIAILIYNELWNDTKIVNNFEEANIILRHN